MRIELPGDHVNNEDDVPMSASYKVVKTPLPDEVSGLLAAEVVLDPFYFSVFVSSRSFHLWFR